MSLLHLHLNQKFSLTPPF